MILAAERALAKHGGRPAGNDFDRTALAKSAALLYALCGPIELADRAPADDDQALLDGFSAVAHSAGGAASVLHLVLRGDETLAIRDGVFATTPTELGLGRATITVRT